MKWPKVAALGRWKLLPKKRQALVNLANLANLARGVYRSWEICKIFCLFFFSFFHFFFFFLENASKGKASNASLSNNGMAKCVMKNVFRSRRSLHAWRVPVAICIRNMPWYGMVWSGELLLLDRVAMPTKGSQRTGWEIARGAAALASAHAWSCSCSGSGSCNSQFLVAISHLSAPSCSCNSAQFSSNINVWQLRSGKQTKIYILPKQQTASMEGGKISQLGSYPWAAFWQSGHEFAGGQEGRREQEGSCAPMEMEKPSLAYQKVSLVRELSCVGCRVQCVLSVSPRDWYHATTMTHKYTLAHASNDDPSTSAKDPSQKIDGNLQFASCNCGAACSFNWILAPVSNWHLAHRLWL